MLEAIFLCLAPIIYDGDSLRCDGERIRIMNIDAPELPRSPKCARGRTGWCDHQKGYQARDALTAFVGSGRVTVKRAGADRFGRTLARVSVNGRDAGEYLVSLGLARPWR